MIIKSITLTNFQLFKSASLNLNKINIISGKNIDCPNESGNGSGKSALTLRAILFCLYGYVEEGLVLKDLIRFGEKEASVELVIEKDNKIYKIIRKIPSDLKIFIDDVEVQANTLSIKQEMINEVFDDVNFFRSYRCVDLRNGVNILDLGITSLRKTLMGFIEDVFTNIRTNLLTKKAEREKFSLDKKLYKHYPSEKRLNILTNSLNSIKSEYDKNEQEKNTQQEVINQIKSEIQSREKIIGFKQQEIKKINEGICPVLKTRCEKIIPKNKPDNSKIYQEINQLIKEIEQYKKQLESEQESIMYYNDTLLALRIKENKIKEKLLRLKSAFQFIEYKYTKSDIVIYDEAIKVLDSFASIYIKNWLDNLAIILNNLLTPLNIRIEFVTDKELIKIYDNNRILKYDMLSTGQKCFLNVIFKLAILLQQNKTGIVLMDDGLGSIDFTNLKSLIEICKALPFQIIGIYQNYVEEIEDVNHFTIIRENGVSYVK